MLLRPVMSNLTEWNIAIDTGARLILMRNSKGDLITFSTQAEVQKYINQYVKEAPNEKHPEEHRPHVKGAVGSGKDTSVHS